MLSLGRTTVNTYFVSSCLKRCLVTRATTSTANNNACWSSLVWRQQQLLGQGAPSVVIASSEQQQQQQQYRLVHSQTQVKRLFKRNAARIRIEAKQKMGKNVGAARTELNESQEDEGPLVFTPQYPPVYTDFVLLPNGWSAPPGPEIQIPQYPFTIKRTKNKPNDAIGFLPVYTKHRKDGTKITTRIRKVTGNRDIFLQELKAALQLPSSSADNDIRIRTGGTIEIKGNHVRTIKVWLAGLGF